MDTVLPYLIAESLGRRYGFAQNQIEHNQPFILSAPRRRVNLDIVVYPESVEHGDINRAVRICLVRPGAHLEDAEKGVTLLDTVLLQLPICEAGLWTNGDVFRYRSLSGGITVELPDLPAYGESCQEVCRPGRSLPGESGANNTLLPVLSHILDRIYVEAGLSGMQRLWQVIYLLITLQQARSVPQSAEEIRHLFEQTKQSHPLLTENDELALRDEILVNVAAMMGRLVQTETAESLGLLYELTRSKQAKGDRGQFFTPANAVRMITQILDPQPGPNLSDPTSIPRIIDPAAGDGRLLQAAAIHLRDALVKRLYPHESTILAKVQYREAISRQLAERISPNLYGIEIDPTLARIARLNMMLSTGSPGNIYRDDALSILNGNLPIGEGDWEWVITNPPYGKNLMISDPDILEKYTFGRSADGRLERAVKPEVLFLELCIRLAKPGTGQIAIVLPLGILSNKEHGPLRDWVLTQCQLLASIQLPREAFLPQVGIGTGILFMRRKAEREIQPDYPILMAVAEQVGHDSRGKIQYKRSPEGDLAFVEEETETLRWANGEPTAARVPLRRVEVWDELPDIAAIFRRFVSEHYYEVHYTEDSRGAPQIEAAPPPAFLRERPVTTKNGHLTIEPGNITNSRPVLPLPDWSVPLRGLNDQDISVGSLDGEEAILIGNGLLDWPKEERVSNRYGCVNLYPSSEAEEAIELPWDLIRGQKKGTLFAVVKEVRRSNYSEDDIYQQFPNLLRLKTPAVGERIVLGSGTVFAGDYNAIGVKPDDPQREEEWLDWEALRRLHWQRVDLYLKPERNGVIAAAHPDDLIKEWCSD